MVTEGHPDILLLREGGRAKPFDFEVAYPAPFIPRSLTFEVPGRIGADGAIVRPLDEDVVRSTLACLREEGVEAVAMCLLWSIVNPAHERRVGELRRNYAVARVGLRTDLLARTPPPDWRDTNQKSDEELGAPKVQTRCGVYAVSVMKPDACQCPVTEGGVICSSCCAAHATCGDVCKVSEIAERDGGDGRHGHLATPAAD